MTGVVRDLEQHNLHVKITASMDPVHPPGWADDVAVLLPLGPADEVAGNLRACIPILDHHSRALGVELNFDSGKTEALVCLRGKNSKEARRHLLGVDMPTVTVPMDSRPDVPLRLVAEYVHLGNTVTHAASSLADVQCKTASADPVFQRLRTTLLRNPELELHEKVRLVETLVLAKIRFGSGLWQPRSQAEIGSVHTALTKHWRQACRPITGHGTKFLDEADVCALLGVLSAQEYRNVDVVRQLSIVADIGPGFLWAALLETGQWLQQAFEALRQVQQCLGVAVSLPDSRLTTLQFLQSGSCPTAGLLRRYAKQCILRHTERREQVTAKAQHIQAFERGGGILVPVPSVPIGAWKCQDCLLRFSCKASMASHRSTVHGFKAQVSFASGSHCAVCNQEWWTTHRLREHLRRSADCRLCYANADLNPAAPFEVVGHKHQLAWRPPVGTLGPTPWWATLRPTHEDAGTGDTEPAGAPRTQPGLAESTAAGLCTGGACDLGP